MKAQYDGIAKQYQRTAEKEVSRVYIEDPNMLRIIGDVTGLDVMGVGCGDSYLERILKRAGANRVVGVDQSEIMLCLAREAEESEPLGIEFHRHNLARLPIIGEFDLVTAKYVLNYAESRDDLHSMCRNIHGNLKPGGRLVALVPDYDQGFPNDPKYGMTVEPLCEPFCEGSKLRVKLYGGESQVQFEVSFLLTGSYRLALASAGFRNITFHQPLPSPEGVEKFGTEFWADWIAHPFSAIIAATK